LNENYDYVYRVIICKTRPKSKQLLLVSFHLSLFFTNLDIVKLHYFALFPAVRIVGLYCSLCGHWRLNDLRVQRKMYMPRVEHRPNYYIMTQLAICLPTKLVLL